MWLFKPIFQNSQGCFGVWVNLAIFFVEMDLLDEAPSIK
jgi:hypothetical protein